MPVRNFILAGLAIFLAGCVPEVGHKPTVHGNGYVEEGYASWYGMSERGKVVEHGKLTASGARYDQNAMTAAHKTLPLGTRVMVTNLENGRRILVVINDRGPYIAGRIIDLTLRGARELGYADKGTAHVRIQAMP